MFEEIGGKWVAEIINDFKLVMRLEVGTYEWRNLNLDALLECCTVSKTSKKGTAHLQKLGLPESATFKHVREAIQNNNVKHMLTKGAQSIPGRSCNQPLGFSTLKRKKWRNMFLNDYICDD